MRERRRNYIDYRTAIVVGSASELAYVAAWAVSVADKFSAPYEDQKAPSSGLILHQLEDAAPIGEKAHVKAKVFRGAEGCEENLDAEVLKAFEAIVDDTGMMFERNEREEEKGWT